MIIVLPTLHCTLLFMAYSFTPITRHQAPATRNLVLVVVAQVLARLLDTHREGLFALTNPDTRVVELLVGLAVFALSCQSYFYTTFRKEPYKQTKGKGRNRMG